MKPQAASQAQYPINPDDLDTELWEAVQSKEKTVRMLAAPPSHWLKENPEADTEQTKSRWKAAHQFLAKADKLPLGWQITEKAAGITLSLSAVAFFILLLIALATEGRDGAWYRLLIPVFFFVAACIGATFVEKRKTRQEKARLLLPETLAHLIPLLERKEPLQTAYQNAVCALLTPEGAGENPATQTLLHDLNALRHSGRQTAEKRAEVEQVMNH